MDTERSNMDKDYKAYAQMQRALSTSSIKTIVERRNGLTARAIEGTNKVTAESTKKFANDVKNDQKGMENKDAMREMKNAGSKTEKPVKMTVSEVLATRALPKQIDAARLIRLSQPKATPKQVVKAVTEKKLNIESIVRLAKPKFTPTPEIKCRINKMMLHRIEKGTSPFHSCKVESKNSDKQLLIPISKNAPKNNLITKKSTDYVHEKKAEDFQKILLKKEEENEEKINENNEEKNDVNTDKKIEEKYEEDSYTVECIQRCPADVDDTEDTLERNLYFRRGKKRVLHTRKYFNTRFDPEHKSDFKDSEDEYRLLTFGEKFTKYVIYRRRNFKKNTFCCTLLWEAMKSLKRKSPQEKSKEVEATEIRAPWNLMNLECH